MLYILVYFNTNLNQTSIKLLLIKFTILMRLKRFKDNLFTNVYEEEKLKNLRGGLL